MTTLTPSNIAQSVVALGLLAGYVILTIMKIDATPLLLILAGQGVNNAAGAGATKMFGGTAAK